MILTASVIGALLIKADSLNLQVRNYPNDLGQNRNEIALIAPTAPLPLKELYRRVIRAHSLEEGIDPEMLTDVAECESSLRDNVYGDQGRAFGILQFHRPTFERFKKEAGLDTLVYEDPISQIRLAAWAFANGKQDSWTCHTKLYRKT